MQQDKYRFNQQTLQFDKVDVPLKKRLAKILIHFVLYFGIFIVLGYSFSFFIDTPSVKGLKRTNSELLLKYELTAKQLSEMGDALSDVEARDNNIYRAIFESDPIPSSIRRGGSGGHEHYSQFENVSNREELVTISRLLDELTWRSYIQSRSFDDVFILAKNKERMNECIPAIQPVSVKDFVRISDFFGMRKKHPVTGLTTFHYGIDFAGSTGTPIHSAGDGVVVSASYSFKGYGNQVIIDHGFGYKTRYAHLKKINVEVGQKVKRTEVIGLMGSTGQSTGPHLHYEVLVRNKPVNPLNYFNDMTEEDYENMLKNASSQFLD